MAKKTPSQHPTQPLELDGHGVRRFKRNAIVEYLLRNGGIDLNKLATLDFSKEDRQQFAQLIGYSLSGYSELNYVDEDSYRKAAATSEGQDPRDAEIAVLKETLYDIRKGLRKPVAELFGIHPDNLMETDE